MGVPNNIKLTELLAQSAPSVPYADEMWAHAQPLWAATIVLAGR